MSLFSPLAIAPMIDWTYTHFRVLMRLLAPNALLYTDMQTTGAILNNPKRALAYHAIEEPLALQLGGSELDQLVECATLAEQHGFAEINLNLGCPSDRVQAGRFGACLMKEPKNVAACIKAMKQSVQIPVSAKTRIGIDEHDSYDFFVKFAQRLVDAGCDKLIIHARKAWLKGLSPKQNRTIPPINYDYVYRFKQDYPHLPIVVNGNITTIEEVNTHLEQVNGVMLGRLACNNPYAIAEIHHALYPDVPLNNRFEILSQYLVYLEKLNPAKFPLSILLKPIMNMTHGLAGTRLWKEQLLKVQQTQQFVLLSDLIHKEFFPILSQIVI